MSDDFLSRWSRRKHADRQGEKLDEALKAPQPVGEAPAPVTEAKAPEPLPPIESLTADSDFAPFMKADVDPAKRREALKVLLRDPRFNVMDGLDVYIDDYSKPDPLPPEWLDQLSQLKHMGHYVEKLAQSGETQAQADAPEPAAQLQKAIAEQPVEPQAPDTAELQNPDAGVGESEPARK